MSRPHKTVALSVVAIGPAMLRVKVLAFLDDEHLLPDGTDIDSLKQWLLAHLPKFDLDTILISKGVIKESSEDLKESFGPGYNSL